VDFLSVLGQLRQSGRLEEVGGSPYLVEVTSEGPAPPETFLGGGRVSGMCKLANRCHDHADRQDRKVG